MIPKSDGSNGTPRRELSPVPISTLIDDHPKLADPVIDGLLRRGETANIIAPSKIGKSWLSYNFGLAVSTGSPIFGTFETHAGRVLIIDNELRPATLANRIPDVANAMALRLGDYCDGLDVLPIRGKNVDLVELCNTLFDFPVGKYDLVIADAFYRFIPEGVSENDNAQITRLFNLIDATTEHLGAAWLNVHHSSKGTQGDKSVTDVGAGAGAMSRAADTHIVLRQHEDDRVYVLEAAVRSFPPIDPLAVRWTFPLWCPTDADTSKLRGKLNRREQRQAENDREGMDLLTSLLKDGRRATASILRSESGLSKGCCDRLLNMLTGARKVKRETVIVRGNECHEYHVVDE